MNVLFTGLFPRWQCHFVAECNFMEEHHGVGDKVFVLCCDGLLEGCDANPGKELPKCLACVGMRQSSLGLLSFQPRRLALIDASLRSPEFWSPLPTFHSKEDLLAFSLCDVPVGKDIVSSLVLALGSPDFDLERNRGLINVFINDFMGVYRTALRYLQEHKIDLVYIFNGRWAVARAWIRACEKLSIDYVTQERLGTPDQVLRVSGGSVHETFRYARLIKSFWKKNSENAAVLKEAHEFFEERPRGKLTGWYSYVINQNPDYLGDNWDPARRNIVIFSSTESEFSGVPEYFVGASNTDQRRAFLDLCRLVYGREESVRFHIRVHPNSHSERVRWWEDRRFAEIPNVAIIPPEAKVSTYGLLSQCEKVVVFMSTVGAEATYWGKPSILLSNAMYRGIGVCYEPKTIEDAAKLVVAPGLAPKNRDAALAFGAFIRCGISKLPLSEAISSTKLTFKGRQPQASEEILTCLWNWENRVSKAALPDWLKKAWQKWQWHKLHPKLKGTQIST